MTYMKKKQHRACDYHDETKSQGCVVLLIHRPIELFEERTLK